MNPWALPLEQKLLAPCWARGLRCELPVQSPAHGVWPHNLSNVHLPPITRQSRCSPRNVPEQPGQGGGCQVPGDSIPCETVGSDNVFRRHGREGGSNVTAEKYWRAWWSERSSEKGHPGSFRQLWNKLLIMAGGVDRRNKYHHFKIRSFYSGAEQGRGLRSMPLNANAIFTAILVCSTHLLVTKVFRKVQRETLSSQIFPETSRLFRFHGGCGSWHINSCFALSSGSLAMSTWRDSAMSEGISQDVKTVQTHV